MSEHPIDRLRHGLDHAEWARDRDLEDDALLAVEQLEQAARELYDEWAAVNPPDLLPLPIQRIGAALALFDRKEQTPDPQAFGPPRSFPRSGT